jgi:hypothetical protein
LIYRKILAFRKYGRQHPVEKSDTRHPAAGDRSGWYERFLQKRVTDPHLYKQARNMRRMLGTEADRLLLTNNYVVLVECKFMGVPSMKQYERHQMMGTTLARRMGKTFQFGMRASMIGPELALSGNEPIPKFSRIQ